MTDSGTSTTESGTDAGAVTGGASVRADLLALTEDSLAALANRGLVKRAVKEQAAGAGGRIATDADGALSADYPDGVVTRLGADSPLADATCSCSAAGLCRHRIGLVLAYQRLHASPAPEPEAGTVEVQGAADQPLAARWSPGDIPDDALERVLGARSVEEARRALKAGFQAVVHRPDATRKPRVELPTCTVTFHIPGDPAYATTDAVELKRGEAVVLAVWAFRAADALGLDGDREQVNVAAAAAEMADAFTPARSDAASAALSHAADLVEGLLLDGVSSAGPLLVGNLRRSARDLTAASLAWPAVIVDDLIAQLEWYLQRSARYELNALADLAAEFLGRRRAATAPARDPQQPSIAQILGTAESSRTALRRIRLIALGCRIHGGPQHRMAEIYFAHPHDGTVLVWRREWKFDDTEQAPTGQQLRTRRVAGTPLHMLAACNLVSEAATRSASRTIELGTSHLAKTTVTTVGEAWNQLPDSVRVGDFSALAVRLGARQPRFLRPRVEAEDIYVLTVCGVEWIGYDPAAQCLEAVVRDERGNTARVRAPYRSICPAALEALSAALTAPETRPLMISGKVTVQGDELVIDPMAVWGCGKEPPVVPDLAVGDETGTMSVAGRRVDQDVVTMPLHTAKAMLAEHAHRGLDRTSASSEGAVEQLAASLARTGFKAVAVLLAAYGETLLRDDRAARVRTWTDASIAVVACLESNG